MKELDDILKRILERANIITKLREKNVKDRAIIEEFEGRKPRKDAPCEHAWIELHGHPAAYECKKCKLIIAANKI